MSVVAGGRLVTVENGRERRFLAIKLAMGAELSANWENQVAECLDLVPGFSDLLLKTHAPSRQPPSQIITLSGGRDSCTGRSRWRRRFR